MLKKYHLIILGIVFIDQILKYFLSFKVKNYGASFSILQNYPALLTIISIIALIAFILIFVNYPEDRFSMSFLIAGTLSNLIDRIFLGYVVDYISLPYLFAFNIADLANTIGVVILMIKLLKK